MIWNDTRSDLKALLRDIARYPSKTYYAVCEADGEHLYREIVFKKSRLWGGTWGHMSAEAVLSNYGPLHDAPPAGAKPLFVDPVFEAAREARIAAKARSAAAKAAC